MDLLNNSNSLYFLSFWVRNSCDDCHFKLWRLFSLDFSHLQDANIITYFIVRILLKCVLFTAQSCLTLCNSMDCKPPVSSDHGVFQARILEWVSISCSKASYQPTDRTWVSSIADRFFCLRHQGSPIYLNKYTQNMYLII